MKAYITNPKATGNIEAGELPAPSQESDQALIRVTHFSLNRGELNFAADGQAGRAIGWDVSGVVEKSAPNGTGPSEGTAVVAFSRAQEGWAELVAIPTRDLAAIPDGVDPAQAATLPVAALTALYALERGERHLGSKVLVTGSTGGVGNFVVNLAHLMGAQVVAQVRREEQAEAVKRLGATTVLVDSEGDEVSKAGPYRLVVDGLGNQLTSKAIHALEPDGVAVLYGVTAGNELSLNPGFMLGTGSGRVEGFNLYRESDYESVARGLQRLLPLVRDGLLKTSVERVVSWEEAPQLAQDLLDRKFGGKAVVRVGA